MKIIEKNRLNININKNSFDFNKENLKDNYLSVNQQNFIPHKLDYKPISKEIINNLRGNVSY
jgi:hypothetical protein